MDDVRSAGIIGAALTVVLTLTLPDGVSDVFVLMRIVPPKICFLCTLESTRKPGALKLLP